MGTRFSGKDLKDPFPKELNVLLHQELQVFLNWVMSEKQVKGYETPMVSWATLWPTSPRMLHLHI